MLPRVTPFTTCWTKKSKSIAETAGRPDAWPGRPTSYGRRLALELVLPLARHLEEVELRALGIAVLVEAERAAEDRFRNVHVVHRVGDAVARRRPARVRARLVYGRQQRV